MARAICWRSLWSCSTFEESVVVGVDKGSLRFFWLWGWIFFGGGGAYFGVSWFFEGFWDGTGFPIKDMRLDGSPLSPKTFLDVEGLTCLADLITFRFFGRCVLAALVMAVFFLSPLSFSLLKDNWDSSMMYLPLKISSEPWLMVLGLSTMIISL